MGERIEDGREDLEVGEEGLRVLVELLGVLVHRGRARVDADGRVRVGVERGAERAEDLGANRLGLNGGVGILLDLNGLAVRLGRLGDLDRKGRRHELALDDALLADHVLGMKSTPTATPTPAEMPILMGTLRFLTSADDLMPFMSMKRVMMATQKATRSG